LTVHSDVESLLALQVEDQAIGEMEARLAALEPRLREMDVAHAAALEALERARRAVEAEEGAHRELQTRIAQHKLLHERNIAQLDSVRRMKEATAAMSQVEQARRILAEEEGALQGISRRLTELRGTVETQEHGLAELEGQHRTERDTIGQARAEVDEQLASRRTSRAGSAARVDRVLLQKYDRIRTVRRDGAIFPLRGPSCGHCDTSVPMQRRNVMAAKGTIEVCETCGVLMYAAT
jgi:uncharacterized protein